MSAPRYAALCALLAVLFTVSMGSVLPAAAEEGPAIDPVADQLLKDTAAYLKEAGQFTFHAEITIDSPTPTGTLIQYGASLDAAVRRPDRLHTSRRGDRRNTSSWYDGKTFTLFHENENYYAPWDAPSNIDELVAKVEERLGQSIPLSSLYLSDPYEAWMEGVEVAAYLGEHLVNGVPTHHIILLQEEIDAQAWIEAGSELVIRKIVLTYKKEIGSPQFTAVFTDWNFSPRLPDRLFTFMPPPDADRIKFKPVGE